jgi:hypothetical protein
MDPRFARNYRHFTRVTPHDTKIVRARSIHYGSYDEDTMSLVLAMFGIGLMLATVVSMLFAFRIF